MSDSNDTTDLPPPASSPSVDQTTGTLSGDARAKALAQAVRFLASLRTRPRGRTPEAIAEQREFLASKGLDGALIAQAEIDATPPASITSSTTVPSPSSAETDIDSVAFAQARAAFDDPLSPPPSIPEKTYPKNVMALYRGQPTDAAPHASHTSPSLIPPKSVLMAFFLKLTGSALYAALVGVVFSLIWRTLALPRMVATRDARSVVLSHARGLVQRLTTHTNAFRRSTTALIGHPVGADIALESDWPAERTGDDEGRHIGKPLKPALKAKQKKVSFSEDTKAPPEVVEDQKDGLAEELESAVTMTESEEGAVPTEPDLPPPDLTAPLRDALAQLSAALRREKPYDQGVRPAETTAVPAVEEEDILLFSDSDEDTDETPDDEEELEFDPYKPTKEEREARRAKKVAQAQSAKQQQATSGPPSDWRRGQAASEFSSAIKRLGRSFETQRFRSSTYAAPAPGDASENGSTVPLVKAEIRSFKGLLLRRRNFPAYRPSTSVATP